MIKRLLDVVAALCGLVLLSPLFLALYIVIAISMGRPVFFRQRRPGLDGQPFGMIKFRSMTDAKDGDGNLLPDSERITKLGHFLRNSSLDELPELWNVLVGDMSLVGPRPLLMEYLPLYNEEQAKRHNVRPGITGWAQINGRNALSWEKKFELDTWYVEHLSIGLDIKILCLTLAKVIKRSDISHDGEATMTKFTGNSGAKDE